MRGNKICFFIIHGIVAALVIGCGSVKTASYFTPPAKNLNNYIALEIMDFETYIPDLPKDALRKVPQEIERLMNSKKTNFSTVKYGRISNIQAQDTLVLLGEFTAFEPGSSFKYEGGALKFGEVTIGLQVVIVEKATGRKVITGEISGFSSTGVLRKGGANSIYESLAAEIVKFLNQIK